MTIRACVAADFDRMLEVINESAQAYRGIIPADRWHDPYMPAEELKREIGDGVQFECIEEDGVILGVMGIQDRGEVALIRHAYVTTARRGGGVGTALLGHLESATSKPILIGTWAAATWAISFYQKNGYTLVAEPEKSELLRRYWSIPERQVETSVVLADAKRSSATRSGATRSAKK